MAYDRVNWVDYPETDTPLTASNLNKMDEGIYDIAEDIGDMDKIADEADGTVCGNIEEMRETFQDGVNKIYTAVTGLGLTPTSQSPDAIKTAIDGMGTLSITSNGTYDVGKYKSAVVNAGKPVYSGTISAGPFNQGTHSFSCGRPIIGCAISHAQAWGDSRTSWYGINTLDCYANGSSAVISMTAHAGYNPYLNCTVRYWYQ